MTHKGRKRVLLLLNTALASALAAAIALAVLPPRLEGRAAGEGGATEPQAARPPAAAPPLEQYLSVCGRDLRKPLFDEPGPPLPPAEPKPKPRLRLTGTAVEPGFTYAVFSTGSGQTKLVRIGQSVDGAEVVAIEVDSATVRFDGQLIRLTAEKKGTGP
jgi:hypothetical protein